MGNLHDEEFKIEMAKKELLNKIYV